MRRNGRYFSLGRMLNSVVMITLLSGVCGFSAPAAAAVVKVKITGMTALVGTIRATLDGSEEAFANKVLSPLTSEAVVVGNTVELVFREVPVGVYAIKVIHDENNDQKLNQNILGIPSEKYGISNNIKGKFGLPDFKDASFTVGNGETLMSIAVGNHTFF